mmetsp:Transcript_23212/g.54891  ORF Transcript_23212/g.54891 Transcript_23212/m.54891 type:complete len:717 (+) Transcript_23212:2869-5019(+)
MGVQQFQRAAVALGDVGRDGQPEAAAGADRGAATAKALQRRGPLGRRDAGPVVLHLQPGAIDAVAAAHRDARARPGIADRVVDQVFEQLPQQEGLAQRGRLGELEAQVHAGRQRAMGPVLATLHRDIAQVQGLIGIDAAVLGARQRQQLLRQPGAALHALAQPLQQRLDARVMRLQHRQFDLGLQRGQRRTQLVGRIRQELALRLGGAGEPLEQPVEGRLQRHQLARQARGQRREPVQIAVFQFGAEVGQWRDPLAHRQPARQRQQHRQAATIEHHQATDLALQGRALVLRLGHQHLADPRAAVLAELHQPQIAAPQLDIAVEGAAHRLSGRPRLQLHQAGVALQHLARRPEHQIEHIVLAVKAKRAVHRRADLDARLVTPGVDLAGQRQRHVLQRVVQPHLRAVLHLLVQRQAQQRQAQQQGQHQPAEQPPLQAGTPGASRAPAHSGDFLEQIAQATHRAQLHAARLDLGAQPGEADLDGVVADALVPGIAGQRDMFLGHDLAGPRHQKAQHIPLAGRQRQRFLVDVGAAGFLVDAQPGQLQLVAGARLAAAHQRTGAGHQLGQREGLDEVVVSAALEATHPVLDRVPRGQDQRRHGQALDTHAAQGLETVDAGQADVEDQQVVGILAQRARHRLTAGGAVHHPALRAQRTGGGFDELFVVFDKQNAHGSKYGAEPLQPLTAGCRPVHAAAPTGAHPSTGAAKERKLRASRASSA